MGKETLMSERYGAPSMLCLMCTKPGFGVSTAAAAPTQLARSKGKAFYRYGNGAMADNLTPEQRSYCMSRIKGKDTRLEVRVRSELHRRGLRFRKHVKGLPGKPDIVFTGAKVVVFIDGDFWHGYRFPFWKHKMSDFWKEKIYKNRERDAETRQLLREMGWKVVRLWQHEIKKDFGASINRIVLTVRGA